MKINLRFIGSLFIVNIVLMIVAAAANAQNKGYDYEYRHENKPIHRDDLRLIRVGDSLRIAGNAPLISSTYYIVTYSDTVLYQNSKFHGVVAIADLYGEEKEESELPWFSVIYDNRMVLDVVFSSFEVDLGKVAVMEWNKKHPDYDLPKFPDLPSPN